MCGVTGFLDSTKQMNADSLRSLAQRMTRTLQHRGPDDSGCWVDAAAGIALGHQRLAILDLSPEGHQPMMSANGRYIIVFNGEIYNFLELKQKLEQLGHSFRGHSDTEVMLASFCQWGLQSAIQKLNGMFAFALWDRQERVLHLGRDRLGEKPLYYGWLGQTLVFGSELKALAAHPQFQPEINRDALTSLLRLKYIPTPHSIYKGIYKLPPGTTLSWQGGADHSLPQSYWSIKAVAESGIADPFLGSEQDAINHLDSLLQDAVGLRMVADVPLGAFLSGGIDSSTVVALMQAQSCQPIKTFSIGFQEDTYNEAQYAKAVAQHLGTEHTELYVTPEEALATIPQLPTLYDEPFADVSQIPTFLVSQLAKQYVTVSLSGDGGDELFGGYGRYLRGQNLWQTMGWIPAPIRQTVAQALTNLEAQSWGRNSHHQGQTMLTKPKLGKLGYTLNRVSELLRAETPETLYMKLDSDWQEPSKVVIGGKEPQTIFNNQGLWATLPDFIQWMMYLDTETYLPDDILVKVDRASMGVSLEGRIPLLDHRVVEFAWRLPDAMRIRNNQGKWLLRQVLHRYIPPHLIDRPKMGFGVPIGDWLRGPLRDWAEALLDERRLQQEELFNPQPIRQKWTEHLSGDRNWQYSLWNILMFQAWFEHHC
ncbi:asparagine synthase (glutamine-hydrolyzing) [Calothrix sp. UHCC 0171]|uniref:asparagine synthase (glutamine-hydrolyzing) n=1 Tax=Calothrix sp. UHCC 0171 TaxID=3110245 RepID=UPI002B1FD2AF|nr:asparagine synthase (glutamine-hydrolyzing) [Calothrix sp. UHCC 0171]MEA5571822.1 asparagine synthase (glutamine-hydrolyzing) [Calothrix sp. UHCC 0171]